MAKDPVPIALIQSIPVFEDFDPSHQSLLASISSITEIKAGDELFHEGDPQDNLYIVLEGRVALEIHVPNRGRLRILSVEPNEVLGWSSITETLPRRTASARAAAASRLLSINSAKLHAAVQEDCALGYKIMHLVANVIAGRLVATRMQLLDMFAQSISEGSHG